MSDTLAESLLPFVVGDFFKHSFFNPWQGAEKVG